ncbi:hypothetical protein chiPu_0018267 [Chiloscyllium punctatum]|uniref:PH domain-containing protein n=1 Tax=Chiloscyllium punctatum TaxID=137246 RepID=A0A401RM78_CHIPU|nr:hypothetical protein [Chiloscyllium punctatum]
MQKGIRLNDGHLSYLGVLAKKDGTRKGYLSKRSSDNTKWHNKWFTLLHNMLFYFENDCTTKASGLYLLEGCVCERAPSPKPSLTAKESLEKQYYFTINFGHDAQKALDLRTEDVKECDDWVAAIGHASYRNLATEHESLMQKYLHLLQIVETEKTVAKRLRHQIEDQEIEVERLKSEPAAQNDEDVDIRKIKKIFYQGLKARVSSWPTLVLADLFDILLPMLNIYQEFVRNHQYSLQILASCKQNRDFDKLLKQYEAKPDCEERTLETFLTYPMFQIPRYILTLHELLAHTPHEHVERKSLEYAKSKLEELSRIMHDEVSETENIRKNLAIERMIVEGCEILLDTSQTFVRQGSLIQIPMTEKGKITRGRLGSLSLRKEGEKQCFLFSKHLIICTRGSGGKLHLTKNGVLSLIDCTLMEDTETTEDEARGLGQDLEHLDFKIVVEPKDTPSFTVILVASSRQEKAAWTSDISQVNKLS